MLRAARGGYISPIENSIAVAWLQRLDRGLEIFYLNEGFYPSTLSQLSSAAVLEGAAPVDGGTSGYRYILRTADNKYDLYGKTAAGRLDPSLMVTRSLDPMAMKVAVLQKHRKSDVRPKAVKIDVVN